MPAIRTMTEERAIDRRSTADSLEIDAQAEANGARRLNRGGQAEAAGDDRILLDLDPVVQQVEGFGEQRHTSTPRAKALLGARVEGEREGEAAVAARVGLHRLRS